MFSLKHDKNIGYNLEELTPDKRVVVVKQRLLAPFLPNMYTFKPGAGSAVRKIPLIAIDPRIVSTRLDQVFGLGGWSTKTKGSLISDEHRDRKGYQKDVDPNLKRVLVEVEIDILVHNQFFNFTQTNVGEHVEWFDRENHFTTPWAQAFKRAAVNMGIGAFMYSMKLPPIDFDKGFGLNSKQIIELLDKNDLMNSALSEVGFIGICEETGQKVSWIDAAYSMHHYGCVLSKEALQGLK